MSEPLLDVRGLSMHFALRGGLARRVRREGHEVLRAVDGVDLQIARGETLGLVGESGCGKSTLGRCIVGLYEPTGGEIRYGSALLPTQRDRATRRRIQMVFQDPYSSLNPRMTVRQTLAELLTAHRMVPKQSVDLYERCRRGDWDSAMQLQRQLWRINQVFAKYNLAACIKGGLELQGYAVGAPLPPQPALSAEGIEEVRLALTELGAL